MDLDSLSKEQRETYWLQIQTEYETTGLSYRKLADKYGVSFHTLSKRAKREGWQAGKENVKNSLKASVADKVRQRVVDRQATRIVDAIDAEMETADNIIQLALEAFQDPRQFYKYAIEETTQEIQKVQTDTTRGKSEKIVKLDTTTTVAKDLGMIDAKRLKDLADALKSATVLKRLLNGSLSELERQKLGLEKERLEIDKTKAGIGAEDDEENPTGIAVLPDVNESLMDNAIIEESKEINTGNAAPGEEAAGQ